MSNEDKLILLTMVKNESRIIRRLMDSVKGRCDGIVVCDTGSTDDTVKIAREYLKENNIPGDVYEYPFKNFGASREKSFRCCQEWVNSQEDKVTWNPEHTWALLLDGDMLLSDKLDKRKLNELHSNIAGVTLKQANGSLIYSNVRVIRCSENWECHGGTHEAWACPPSKETILFEQPVLTDYGDGGCKSDKYERDVRLLLEDIKEKPNDARSWFYLGQTYLCLRDWEKAIGALKTRIQVGGWDEETYMAQVYLGECYENIGEKGDATRTWLEAWQRRQHRTEAAMKLVKMYRLEDKSQFIGHMFLDRLFQIQKGESLTGIKLGNKADNRDMLFVNKRDVEYHMYEELMILSYYINAKPEAWVRLDELDLTNSLGWHDFNGLFGQLHWYDWFLKPLKKTRFAIPLERLPWAKEEHGEVWQSFNPSIRKHGSGYQLNLRYANYFTHEAKHYQYRGFNGQVLTRNTFLTYEDISGLNWNTPTTVNEILIDPKFQQDTNHYIRGIEDCRLVQGSDKYEYLGTSQSYSDNKTNKIFHVHREEEEEKWSIKQMPLPPGVNAQECQKNWLPFMHSLGTEKELLYIYSFSPFRICDAEGNLRVFQETSKMLKEWRGSAGPVPWSSSTHPEEAYLCAMHKVYIGGDGRRYYHRFMTLTKNLKPSRVSCFLRMTRERVEYWSGLTESQEEGKYVVTYGMKDCEAEIAELSKEQIEELLFYTVPTKPEIMTKSLSIADRLAVIRKYYQ